MKMKRFIILISLFIAYMLFLHFTTYCIFPKLSCCRFTGKPVYIWNAKGVEYVVRINGKDTNFLYHAPNGGIYIVRMSGFVHKSYDRIPVVDVTVEINWEGNPTLLIKERKPGEAILFIILTPKPLPERPQRLLI